MIACTCVLISLLSLSFCVCLLAFFSSRDLVIFLLLCCYVLNVYDVILHSYHWSYHHKKTSRTCACTSMKLAVTEKLLRSLYCVYAQTMHIVTVKHKWQNAMPPHAARTSATTLAKKKKRPLRLYFKSEHCFYHGISKNQAWLRFGVWRPVMREVAASRATVPISSSCWSC